MDARRDVGGHLRRFHGLQEQERQIVGGVPTVSRHAAQCHVVGTLDLPFLDDKAADEVEGLLGRESSGVGIGAVERIENLVDASERGGVAVVAEDVGAVAEEEQLQGLREGAGRSVGYGLAPSRRAFEAAAELGVVDFGGLASCGVGAFVRVGREGFEDAVHGAELVALSGVGGALKPLGDLASQPADAVFEQDGVVGQRVSADAAVGVGDGVAPDPGRRVALLVGDRSVSVGFAAPPLERAVDAGRDGHALRDSRAFRGPWR